MKETRLHIPFVLASAIRCDLERPHPIAAERVGIAFVRRASAHAANVLVILDYQPIPEHTYVKGRAAANFDLGWILERGGFAASQKCGLMWVHMHDHPGPPRFSEIDTATSGQLCSALRIASPNFPQGALLLSRDAAIAQVFADGSLIDVGTVREMGRFDGRFNEDLV